MVVGGVFGYLIGQHIFNAHSHFLRAHHNPAPDFLYQENVTPPRKASSCEPMRDFSTDATASSEEKRPPDAGESLRTIGLADHMYPQNWERASNR